MLEAFHFLRPMWLFLLVPFAALIWYQLRRSDLRNQWRTHFAPHLLPLMIIPGSERRLFSPVGLGLLLYLLLTIAVAGPTWKRGESPFAEDAAALIIAMDLSASMAQDDLQPSRLQRARAKALEVARARCDAYTALVAYAGGAYTVLPLLTTRAFCCTTSMLCRWACCPGKARRRKRCSRFCSACFAIARTELRC